MRWARLRDRIWLGNERSAVLAHAAPSETLETKPDTRATQCAIFLEIASGNRISQSQVVDTGEGENINECREVCRQTLTLVRYQTLILSYRTPT